MLPTESVVDTDVMVWDAGRYVHDAGIEVGNRVAAVTSADLVAREGACHAAENGTAIVAPADTARFVDPLAGAFLAGNIHAFTLRIDAANAGIVDVGFGVKPDRCSGEKREKGKAFHGGSLGWCEHLPVPV
jgi:hypothetical protein